MSPHWPSLLDGQQSDSEEVPCCQGHDRLVTVCPWMYAHEERSEKSPGPRNMGSERMTALRTEVEMSRKKTCGRIQRWPYKEKMLNARGRGKRP